MLCSKVTDFIQNFTMEQVPMYIQEAVHTQKQSLFQNSSVFLTVVRIYITNHPVTPAKPGEGIIHGVMRTYAVWPPCRRSHVSLNHASHCHLRGRTLFIMKFLTSLFSIMFFKMYLKKYKRISHFKITRIRFSINLSVNKHQKKKRRNEGREGEGQGEREGGREKRQDQNNSQSFTYFKGGITNRLSS